MARYSYDRPQSSRTEFDRSLWSNPANPVGLVTQLESAVEDPLRQSLEEDRQQQALDLQMIREERQLAQDSMQLDRERRAEAEAIGAISAINELDPTSPDYLSHRRVLGTKYPLAFINPRVANHLEPIDRAARAHTDRLREEYGVGEDVNPHDFVQYGEDGRPDYSGLRALGIANLKDKLKASNDAQAELFRSAVEQMGGSMDDYAPALDAQGRISYRPKRAAADRIDPLAAAGLAQSGKLRAEAYSALHGKSGQELKSAAAKYLSDQQDPNLDEKKRKAAYDSLQPVQRRIKELEDTFRSADEMYRKSSVATLGRHSPYWVEDEQRQAGPAEGSAQQTPQGQKTEVVASVPMDAPVQSAPAAVEKIEVINSSGQRGFIPATNLEAALKAGFRQAK